MTFFDKIYCINLNHRKDRWLQSQHEFARIGIEVERFEAHEGDNKHLAFNSSQYHVIQKALKDGCNRFLVLEDDVIFQRMNHLETALKELPTNWDLVYLGGNVIGSDQMNWKRPMKYSKHLCRLFNAWQTQSVGYSRKGAQYVLNNFDYKDFPIYDEWLRVNMLTDKLCYIVNPQITYQRPGISDIWGGHTDYTSCWSEGNKRMAV